MTDLAQKAANSASQPVLLLPTKRLLAPSATLISVTCMCTPCIPSMLSSLAPRLRPMMPMSSQGSSYPKSFATPLDFYGVTDHAFYLGVLREMADPDSELSRHPVAAGMDSLGGAAERGVKFREVLGFLRGPDGDELNDPEVGMSAWSEIVAAANRHKMNFTTFDE